MQQLDAVRSARAVLFLLCLLSKSISAMVRWSVAKMVSTLVVYSVWKVVVAGAMSWDYWWFAPAQHYVWLVSVSLCAALHSFGIGMEILLCPSVQNE
jgi:flagellar biosynthesis protein FliR